MRKLIFAILLLLGVVFVFINLSEVQSIAETLQRGDWRYLLLALAIQSIWILNVAATFRMVYKSVGLEEKIEKLYILSSAANFVNVVAPTGGMGGLAVFISEGRRRGYSSARVAVAGGLYVLFDYMAFLTVLALGFIVLFRRNNLNATEVIASGVLVVVALVLALLVYLGMRSADAMGRMLAWMARQVNRFVWLFIQREYLSEQRAYGFASDASEGLQTARKNPEAMLWAYALALSSKALMISILFFVFLAFKVPFSVGTLIAGYSIGYLFLIVSPTPAGIGVVEGAMTIGLRSLNVPLGAATVITLAYRGITFWTPLFFGFLAFRWLSRTPKAELPADSSPPPVP